jgi:hypothetical protein
MGQTLPQWLEHHHKYARTARMATEGGQADDTGLWKGMETREALDFMDKERHSRAPQRPARRPGHRLHGV